jgi:hypothetical protein
MAGNRPPDSSPRTGDSLRAPGVGVSVAAILLKIESHPFGYRDAIRKNFTKLNNQ